MPIVPFAPPQPVARTDRGFDYVTVDATRRRVYAAHGGNNSLLIVNADTGKVLSQVKVGPMAGVAVNKATGDVYTGDGDDQAVSEVNPVTMKEVHRVSVAGHVDAIAYDPQLNRIYADEDDGTRIFVIDSKTFKQLATIPLPGHKPEYIVVHPQTHVVYQNIASDDEIAVIDPATMKVRSVFKTPQIHKNHPLQYDPVSGHLLAGGTGHLAVYTTSGKNVATVSLPPHVDQCSLDPGRRWIACAASNSIVLYALDANGVPKMIERHFVGEGMHTIGIDQSNGRIWVVWDAANGDFVQGFDYRP